ncbi:MAG: SDR family NAD(P)-dependent oxidoreductase [Ruminococcaceae bacterium]|nr:SDR family NAD(P)-dependent oxidoreductase [Oscillospiraceae bacterium]
MKPSVLITGAYGGMGRATAKAMQEKGFRVFALDQDVGAPEDSILPVEADITDETSVRKAFRQISAQTEELCAVIHFAGVYMLDSLVEMDNAAFEKIFRINLGGVFLVNKIFLPLLKAGSRIVITTSELAPLAPLPFTGVYAVTKSALDKYAYSLRMELQLQGVCVSVLRAGAVSTGMLGVSTDALDRFCRRTVLYTCNADRFRRIVDRVESRSIAPDRIADKVLRILKQRRPRFAYSINRNPLLLILNLLPQEWQFFVIRQVLKNRNGEAENGKS